MRLFETGLLLLVTIGCDVEPSKSHTQPPADSAKAAESPATAAPEPYTPPENATFQYMATQLIPKFLKAPSTASFAPDEEWKLQRLDEHTCRVAGWVDAQNAFGAMLRNQFVADVNFDGKDYWHLTYLKLGDSDEVYGAPYEPTVPAVPKREIPKPRPSKPREKAPLRMWKSADGKFTASARIVSIAGDVVTIEREDGVVKKVPLEKLCDDDRQYVADWKKNGR